MWLCLCPFSHSLKPSTPCGWPIFFPIELSRSICVFYSQYFFSSDGNDLCISFTIFVPLNWNVFVFFSFFQYLFSLDSSKSSTPCNWWPIFPPIELSRCFLGDPSVLWEYRLNVSKYEGHWLEDINVLKVLPIGYTGRIVFVLFCICI